MSNPTEINAIAAPSWKYSLKEIALLVVIVYAFLVSLELMSGGFRLMGEEFAQSLVATAGNPFVGLFVGMLATALIQSSSVTTSAVVVMVASGAFGSSSDPATLSLALPVIMGANVGTTITSTIVSLGHITVRSEYRRAISTATLHNIFNIITVLILFPLEYFFGVISLPASKLASWIAPSGPGDQSIVSGFRFVRHAIEPLPKLVLQGISDAGIGSNLVVPSILVLLSLALLFFSLWQLTKKVRQLMIGNMKERLEKVFFGHPLKALGWGIGITALVQSSSATTSLTVPLVATGKVALRKAFPFIIGANIGTTATAILAALLTIGDQFQAGLAVAFCHVLFNVFGALILFPIPQVRRIPVAMARKLGAWTLNNRLVGISYIAITFFLIPFLLILASNQVDHEAIRKQKAEKQSESLKHPENQRKGQQ